MEDRNPAGRQGSGKAHRALWCGLALYVEWSAVRFRRFAEYVGGDVRGWLDGGEGELDARMEFLTKRQRTQLRDLRRLGAAALEARMRGWMEEVVLYGDEEYPTGLSDLKRPPAALHLRGDRRLLGRRGIAVVGSRKIGVKAASTARRILEPAVSRGLTVISGGALGADAVAHRCALDCGGSTVAVLPSGLSNLTPKRNRRLFHDIAEGRGLLLSEYAPDCGVRRYHFRRRNGLMAAMSRGVFVLRAAAKSGTMLTVDAARELERPLAAMPGSPEDPISRGCHETIRRGGAMIADGDDLLQWWKELGGDVDEDEDDEKERARRSDPDCQVLRSARRLVDASGSFSMEVLVRETGLSAAQLQSKLLQHELAGIIERAGGGDRFRFLRA